MKNMMIAAIAVMAVCSAFGITVKQSEVITGDKFWTDKIASNVVDKSAVLEIKDLVWFDAQRLVYLANGRSLAMQREVDELLAGHSNLKYVNVESLNRSGYPKSFPILAEMQKSKFSPVKYACFVEIGRFNDYYALNGDQAVRLLNSGELNFNELAMCNNAIKNAGVKVVKKWLRVQGKTFVAKTVEKKDADGKTVKEIVNPLSAPMKELTDALNAAKYEGLNAWIDKYGAGWTKFDGSKVLTDAAAGAVMDSVLIDETPMSKVDVKLRIYLGVKGFNDFVKLYNNGEAND